jgi:hypothetical protein
VAFGGSFCLRTPPAHHEGESEEEVNKTVVIWDDAYNEPVLDIPLLVIWGNWMYDLEWATSITQEENTWRT